jgi:hypothetical protein
VQEILFQPPFVPGQSGKVRAAILRFGREGCGSLPRPRAKDQASLMLTHAASPAA